MIFPFAFVWDLHFLFLSLSYAKREVALHPIASSDLVSWTPLLDPSLLSLLRFGLFFMGRSKGSVGVVISSLSPATVLLSLTSSSPPSILHHHSRKKRKKSGILRKCIGTMLVLPGHIVLALPAGAFSLTHSERLWLNLCFDLPTGVCGISSIPSIVVSNLRSSRFQLFCRPVVL